MTVRIQWVWPLLNESARYACWLENARNDKQRCFSLASDTLTANNVVEVLEFVNDWHSLQSPTYIEPRIIPPHLFSNFDEKCSTRRERAFECASYYVQRHPQASWTHLADLLYERGESAAVEKLKPHLPLRG